MAARSWAGLVTSLVLVLALPMEAVTVTSRDELELPRQQDAGQLISLLSSLATQGGIGGIPDLLQQVPGVGGFLQQTGPAQFPSSMVGQLVGDYLPTQGLGQFFQGLGQYQQQHQPPGANLVGALTAIAAYDDLQCVPRLLCEVAAGGKPGQSAKQDSLIPFLNKDTLITLLTIFNLGGTSPLLVFGRAVLLGVTAQGRPSACLSAYPTCPRDPDQLVYYLNNHRGGFFQFFNNFRRPPVLRPNQGRIQNYASHGVHGVVTTPAPPTITAPPPPPPLNQHYQQHGDKPQYVGQRPQFPFLEKTPDFKDFRKGKILKFPFRDEENEVYGSFVNGAGTSSGIHFAFPENEVDASSDVVGEPGRDVPYHEAVAFPAVPDGQGAGRPPRVVDGVVAFPGGGGEGGGEGGARPPAVPMVFPDRTGTGDLRLDTDGDGNPVVHSVSGGSSGAHVFRTSEHPAGGRGLRFPSAADDEEVFRRESNVGDEERLHEASRGPGAAEEHFKVTVETSFVFPRDIKSS